MKLNNLFVLTLLLFSMMFVSASDLPSIGNNYRINQNVTLYQGCESSTYSNISSVYYPNSSIALGRTVMVGSNNYYTYNFTKANTRGMYIVTGYCDEDGLYTDWSYTFEVEGLSGVQGTLAIFIVLFIGFLTYGCIYLANNKVPQGDNTNEEGKIISINLLKYLRFILWGVAWGLITINIFILHNYSLVYLNNALISNILFLIYRLAFWTIIISFPVYFVWLIAKFFQDREMQQMIERGVDIKSEYG